MAKGKSSRGTGLLTGLVNLTDEGVINEKGQRALDFPKEEKSSVEKEVLPEPIIEPVKEVFIVKEEKSKPKKFGRPQKYKNTDKVIKVAAYLLEDEVKFLEKFGGEFGGKSGYIKHLVDLEMKRVNS